MLGTVSPAFAQEGKKITGQVVDDTNEPLIGASILVVGTSTGVITDLDGNFNIIVPSGATALQISYVGYETVTVPVPSGNTVNVKMKSDKTKLAEKRCLGEGSDYIGYLKANEAKSSNPLYGRGIAAYSMH